ncbi:Beta-hexosaminidase [Lachnellula suecica]|uniref:Beta-hexosaminidase n=1 Tax=Lachnellula suecica TaxID=602035 RepID=A0A8T9CK48_9HELO|nr:Beta-hexosaminidase [Lachnellula suecica]
MWSPFCLMFVLACQVLAIWPAPKSLSTGSSVLWIEPSVQITYNGGAVRWIPIRNDVLSSDTEQTLGEQVPYANGSQNGITSKAIVLQAVNRSLEVLFSQNLVPWKLVARGELSELEPAADSAQTCIKTITITQTGTDNSSSFKPLAGQVDESYNISIATDGTASITAVSYVGVLHALESFLQLFYQHSAGAGIYTNLAPIEISDAPKFQHRALNMDVSRNWYGVDDILKTIDAISWNKFNILHLHVSDAQSWPMEVPSIPELAQKGAYQAGLTYSPDDIKNIQTYAIARGVEVIIEFDMPGHTTSIGFSHPELIAAFNAMPWDTYCAEPPCGSLKLNSPAVYDFLEKLFADVLPRVSPYSSYFHTGGDEVNVNAYLLDDTVNSNDTAVIQPLIQKLVDRNHDQIRKAGLTPMVWEEMLLQWNITLGDDVVVQAWQSDEAVSAVTGKGHKVVGGNYNFWYLDCGKGQWLNFGNGASFQTYYPFNDYCSPTKSWRLVYSYDPLAGVPENETHLVLGAEVHIWSEQTDPVNLDSTIWPRASAAGEILWSGRQDASGQNRSQITAAPRLAEMRERMLNRGIQVGPVQMIFCTQSNATECAL